MAIGGGLWAAILGYCFTFYNAQVQEQRKARLERVNQQLKDLYGPLLACVTATKSAYEAMVRQHSPDGSRQALQSALLARPYGPEAHAFRLWMTSVLQPLNERAAAIVQGGFSLLEGVALEPQLLQLVAHVSASRVVLERWAQGELATGSAISYPDKLEGMVRQEFARLKARQAELLGVTTPKTERLANKHAECSAPMHAPSSACDTSSGHGPDSVEGCVEGDSSSGTAAGGSSSGEACQGKGSKGHLQAQGRTPFQDLALTRALSQVQGLRHPDRVWVFGPTELCYWDGRPAMPKLGRPGQEWVYLRDKALLRKWRRKWRR
ncbi:hypothetical protein QJQ45_017451 [Haematococcus lacustris]|nr:hypothetical protein QJQ45_017451 [Haematococcus lacustris]